MNYSNCKNNKCNNYHKNKKESLKDSLCEVECFLNNTNKISDIFKILKIAKKNNR